MLKDFKPALLFLVKFLAVYFVSNIVYGLYIESCGDTPDFITKQATAQTALIIQQVDEQTQWNVNPNGPTVFIKHSDRIVLNVFEGCNGINVMIVFVAFMVAFGGDTKKIICFTIFGIIVIHLANLGRLTLLYYVSQYYEQYFYFIHKYFFTAILYLIVFILWIVWVAKFNPKKIENAG